jgi:hypothetical protein
MKRGLFTLGADPRQKFIPDHNPIAIDDLRISAVVRKPEELGFNAGSLKPDRHTLLLLDFDRGATTIVAGHSAAEPVSTPTLPSRWRYIGGKFGRALSFKADSFATTSPSQK